MSDQQTPLHSKHLALGAKMTPFAGFEMPVQYTGIIDEHLTVRERVGMFDVSHMGEVLVTGPEALDFIQRLVTNDAEKLFDGRAMYTVMCREDGGIVDDLLVYRLGADRYMLVINASNIESDLAWMRSQKLQDASIENISGSVGLIAVQGPSAFDTVSKISPVSIDELKFYHFAELETGSFFGCKMAILSHTGYTGESGLEIYSDADRAGEIWDALFEAGEEFGIKPIGLGARDTLRLESGFCLYGNDITIETNPLEAGLGWLTKLDKRDFVGRNALAEIKEAGPGRKLVGFVSRERGIPRPGDTLLDPDGQQIGHVTSGTQSPILRAGIGLGYVTNRSEYTSPGSDLSVRSRNRSFTVRVQQPPFHKVR
ncbi:MAG: glycine cleavage system aminomethyltransferase GcvT [Rhodothermia bacterium]|nr:MAG: glycine cleavage system aminomethyltransferase GcvT [Rhodothermia bacterium]